MLRACRLLPLLIGPLALAQSEGQATDTGSSDFDACGTLVRTQDCVLFDGGGGRYALSNYGRFQVGDAVRVVGTLDPSCVTICGQADGCIRGALLYDPVQYPCGTNIPSLSEDLLPSLCATASGALGSIATGGLWLARRGHHRVRNR